MCVCGGGDRNINGDGCFFSEHRLGCLLANATQRPVLAGQSLMRTVWTDRLCCWVHERTLAWIVAGFHVDAQQAQVRGRQRSGTLAAVHIPGRVADGGLGLGWLVGRFWARGLNGRKHAAGGSQKARVKDDVTLPHVCTCGTEVARRKLATNTNYVHK